MFNWRHRRLLRQAWHPSDEELLLHVEGEADARGARQIADHLSGCWSCRARRADIERAIGAYMSYHRDPARDVGEGDDPEQATRRFATALARAKHADVRGESGFRRGVWMLARAAVFVAAVVFIVRWWMAPTPVSARELLDRVDRAQQQELGAVADPVVYQKLRVTRADVSVARRAAEAPAASTSATSAATVTWEVWSSQRQRRVVERGGDASPLLVDLQAVLRDNGMEPGQPLSPASLIAWRRFAGHVTEDVRDTTLADGAAAVTLTSSAPGPVANGRIARSEVTVRTRDWHPVAHTFTVAAAAGEQQYTVTELGYRVVPLAGVDTAIAASFAETPLAPAVTRTEPAVEAAAPRPSSSSSASPALERAAAAVQAFHARHTSGTCVDAAGTATQHLFAVRELAEWYRTLEDNGVKQGLDGRSAALLATMIRDHLKAARQRLPASGEAAAQASASDEPWTTVAMKAYAAVEYASRSGDANAITRARALVDALERATLRLARGG